MPRYNTIFELDVDDLELIETALQQRKSALSMKRLSIISEDAESDQALADIDDTLSNTHDLLGRLHNQKVWYRPTDDTKTPYVGG
ncbi:MAG: hypothetical protein AAGA05_01460 [Pseudomonadota bacterium]